MISFLHKVLSNFVLGLEFKTWVLKFVAGNLHLQLASRNDPFSCTSQTLSTQKR